MGRADKWLAQMREGRTAGWRFSQVRSVLEERGFQLRDKASGSHRIFKHPAGVRLMVQDKGSGKVRPVYVERAVSAIDNVEGGNV